MKRRIFIWCKSVFANVSITPTYLKPNKRQIWIFSPSEHLNLLQHPCILTDWGSTSLFFLFDGIWHQGMIPSLPQLNTQIILLSAIYCVLQLKWPGTLFILNISLLYKTRLQIMFNLLWFCHLCAYEWRHLFHRQHPLLISILFLKSFQSILHPLLSVYFLECQLHYV